MPEGATAVSTPDDGEIASGAAERLTFFSDAVVAIAITLLALELKVPAGHTISEFWTSVGDGGGEYLAFVLSFWVIARHWRSHHSVFRYVARADGAVFSLNLFWLLWIVVIPFVTRILNNPAPPNGVDPTQPLRFAIYALVQLLTDLTFLGMLFVMGREPGSMRPGVPDHFLRGRMRRAGSFAAAFGLSVPLFLLIDWAWVLWFAVPLTTLLWWRFRNFRRTPRKSAH